MNGAFRSIQTRLCMALAAGAIALAGGCGSANRAATSDHPTRSYAFWPQFPDDPHVQFVASYGSSEDVSPTQVSDLERLVFGKEAEKSAIIDKPYGVAMKDGKVYVCDMRSKALTVLDLKTKQTRLVGTGGFNRLSHPVAVAIADDGTIYVADNDRGAIFVYDASERYVNVFGFPNFKPSALAVHADRLYATDLTTQSVQVFDRRDGKRLATIGSVGDEDGQFRLPLGLATDKSGNLYVVDMMRCRVQKFSPEGAFISGMGQLGDYAGSFARPKHIAVDGDGIIYVVDASFQNLQMFDDQYRLLMHIGSAGDFPGSMDLPAGVAVCDDSLELFADKIHPGFAPKRLIVVTNQFGPRKVSIYALGELRAGYTAQDLAAAAATIPSGVGTPTDEMLKIQNPGGIEPPTDPKAGDPGAKPDSPPRPSKPPEPQ